MKQEIKGLIMKRVGGIWSIKLYYQDGSSYQMGGMYKHKDTELTSFADKILNSRFVS